MHILCPHCRNPIELVQLTAEEIVCPTCGSSFKLDTGSTTGWTPTEELRKIGKFEILSKVGVGAFGTVYKARDRELDRIVAIKVPRAGNLSDGQDLDRFLREARSVAQLRHPGIVPVYDVGQADGIPFLVSDFVDGVTLADQLTARQLSPREAAQLIAQVADALQYAHERGIVHRDVKPSNIILSSAVRSPSSPAIDKEGVDNGRRDNGLPMLMDFGLAKREAGEITMTLEGQVLGTPAYMSPEQARGAAHQVDGRSDVYSLGVIFYRLLTGELPFRGNTQMLLHQVLHDEPTPPRKLNNRIPRDLETICLKAMAKSRKQRYQTAGELADDLRRYLKGEPIRARPVGMWERGWRWARRRPAAAGLLFASGLTILALVGTGVALAYTARLSEEKKHAEEARQLAELEKDRAEKFRQQAESAQAEAERQRQLAQRYLYASDMNLAHRAWRDGQMARMLDLLERHRSERSGDSELPGFEWHYLWRLGHMELRVFKLNCLAYSPDGKHLVCSRRDRKLCIWNLGKDEEERHFPIVTDPWTMGAYSPDGALFVSATTRRNWVFNGPPYQEAELIIWDTSTGQQLGSVHHPMPYRDGSALAKVTFSPNGKQLVASGTDGVIRIWDLGSWKETLTIETKERWLGGFALSPDGNYLATRHQRGIIHVWEATTGREFLSIKLDAADLTLAYHPDGKQLASGHYDGSVGIWDAVTGKKIASFKASSGQVSSVAFSPNGRQFASAGEDQCARIWDSQTHKELTCLRGHHGWVRIIAFSPDGQELTTAGADGTVRVWQTLPAQDVFSLPVGGSSLEFCPDSKHLLSGLPDGSAKLWDTADGKLLMSHKGMARMPASGAVALSPDGKQFVAAGDEGVKLWDTESGREIRSLQGKPSLLGRIAYSPDGKLIAGWGKDSLIKIWMPPWERKSAPSQWGSI